MVVYCIYSQRNNLHARGAEMSKNFYSIFSRVVSTPRHKYSVNVEAKKKTPLMLLFTYKQTEVIYVRVGGNFEYENNLIIPCLCFIMNLNVIK